MKDLNTGCSVTIKGYKKEHKIKAVYKCTPPRTKSFTYYEISGKPENKRYLRDDLILIN